MKKTAFIIINTLPVILMIALIPLIMNDYTLALIYLAIIIIALIAKREKNDLLILALGFFIMIASEYFFISTGVEVFQRRTLLDAMPNLAASPLGIWICRHEEVGEDIGRLALRS